MRGSLAIVLLVLMIFAAEAKTKKVNLDRMSEKRRTEYLIAKAKEVVMRHGPGYYREYAAPEIKREVFDTSKIEVIPQSFEEENANRALYIVCYPYDKTKEIFWGKYSAAVEIWADTGEPFGVLFGNGWGYDLYRFTDEEIKSGKRVMPYDSTRHLLKYRDAFTRKGFGACVILD